jgi:hypothetical protein
MSIYYPGAACESDIPQHICNPCTEFEKGRVRSIAFIHKDYVSNIVANPTDTAVWQTGITSGQVRIIPDVSGTSNGGEKVAGAGYGDQKEKVTGRNYTVNFKDPNYVGNCSFYTELELSRAWHLAYKTETLLHVSDKVVSTFANNPTTENLEDDVVWNVESIWFQKVPVCPLDAPDNIFDCFQLTV